MISAAMLTLGVDSSTNFLSVGICDGDQPLAETTFDAGRTHAERIIDVIDQVLGDAKVTLADLGLLVVAQGPGSFTGIRIGVATLKGLALGTGLPLVGVSTLTAMARAAGQHETCVCPLVDAKMNEVFGAIFRRDDAHWRSMSPERVGPIESFIDELPDDCLICGDGPYRYAGRFRAAAPNARVLPESECRPSGLAVAAEGLLAYRAGNSGDPALVKPVYLRQSQPEELRRLAAEKAQARA